MDPNTLINMDQDYLPSRFQSGFHELPGRSVGRSVGPSVKHDGPLIPDIS